MHQLGVQVVGEEVEALWADLSVFVLELELGDALQADDRDVDGDQQDHRHRQTAAWSTKKRDSVRSL